jgi:hypothetical protein
MSISETSKNANIPAVRGENTAGGSGISGHSKNGRAVEGWSETNYGVSGDSQKFPGVRGSSVEGRGVEGWSTKNDGVWGISTDASGVHGVTEGQGTGVVGESRHGRGVHGISGTWQGVLGSSTKNAGIVGESKEFHAVYGISHDPNNGGVFGTNDNGGWGIIGRSDSNTGVSGESNTGVGVHGKGGRLAGLFEGDVEVTGDLQCPNGDCAEDFDMAGTGAVDPGTVMVLDSDGALVPSARAYDRCVAGVISGAGAYRPAIVLDKQPKSNANRQPLALVGKVFCKVDAEFGPIAVGDLLTTSATPGHAMIATDVLKAFGTVIGKALRPLAEGRGLIPILIALQ